MDLDTAPPRRTFSFVVVAVGIVAAAAVIVLPLLEGVGGGDGDVPSTSPHVAPDNTHVVTAPKVLVFEAEADGSVFGATPGRVLSNDHDLRIDADPRIESVIAFTVANLDAPVAAAVLRLHALSDAASPIRASPTDPRWDETLLSYQNRPRRISPEFREGTTGPAGSWVAVDVTPFVDSNGRFSFTLDQDSRTLIRLSAREGDHPPQLVVTLAPPNDTPPVAVQPDVHLSSDRATWTPQVEDAEERPLTCALVRAPKRGVAELATDCSSISYVAEPGSAGADRFDYTVTDGIYVVGVPTNIVFDAPVGVPVASPSTTFGSLGAETTVELRGFDPDGRCPITFVIDGTEARGAVGPVEDVDCWKGYATARVPVSPPKDATRGASFEFAVIDVDDLRSEYVTAVVRDATAAPVVTVLPDADGAAAQEMDEASVSGPTLRIDAEPISVAYLLFDLRDIPLEPTSAALRLHFSSSSFEGIAVHAGSSAWSEATLLTGRQPDFAGTPLVRTGPVWDGEWIDVPIPIDLLQEGLVSLALTTSGSRAVSVGSAESRFPPALLITQNVPGTLGAHEGVGR